MDAEIILLDTGGEYSETSKDRVPWEYSSGWENEKRHLAMRADDFAGRIKSNGTGEKRILGKGSNLSRSSSASIQFSLSDIYFSHQPRLYSSSAVLGFLISTSSISCMTMILGTFLIWWL